MKRVATGFCVAATLGCIATLGAQTSTTPTTAGQRTATTEKAREVSVTGCLSKGADGKFMLTNARIDPAGSASTGTSGTSTSSTPTTTPGTTAAGSTAANAPAMSFALMGGSDLDKHVGHKIQVSGNTAWDPSMSNSRTPSSSSAGAGTTAGTTTGTTAAGTSTGTSGTTSTAATEDARKNMSGDQPRLDVQSVKMIAPSCS